MSFGIVSDDGKQDSAFILAKLITDECMKLTADGKNAITIISDGAARVRVCI